MKIFQIALAASVFLASCSAEEKKETTESNVDVKEVVTDTVTLDFTYMDTTASPKVDFYQYANGTWLAENPIPDEESRWSSFNVLSDRNNDVLRDILEKAKTNIGEEGSATYLIGNYYISFTDTVTRNEKGHQPIDEYLAEINTISSPESLVHQIAKLHSIGVRNTFGSYVMQDAKQIELYRVHLYQSGLGLPSKDYYFNEDERTVGVREAYKLHIAKMFELSGFSEGDAKKNAEIAYGFEEGLADVSLLPVEMRDPDKMYNPMTVADLSELSPAYNWSQYLSNRKIGTIDTLVIDQVAYMAAIGNMVENISLENWKVYLQWRLINSFSQKLDMEMERENFAFFFTKMRGTKKMKPLWKRGINAVSGSAVGEALGQAYVEENFSENAQKKVNEMVDNITLIFDERIEALEWMSKETKAKAKEKLGGFTRKLGFPDEWEDFSGVKIAADDYVGNTISSRTFEIEKNIAKLGTPIDKTEWGMYPQIINAYYNPSLNEIVFPAGIMQAPFFNENYEDAVNYARMGAVIGHELTHGFDDQGAQYDATGKMENWWTSEDSAKFSARTQKLIDQYSTFEVLEGVFVDGELTLGENIADLGGLTIAYYAYQRSLEGKEKKVINGYTPEQRFFIAFGQVWKNNIRDGALVVRVKSDPHSPGKYRVNGAVSNMPEFFEAFDVQEGDPMRQAEGDIAKIW